MPERITYKWRFIEDLPENWTTFSSPRLRSLSEIWKEQRCKLNQSAINQFNEKLKRQWAIETGVIENLYTLDRGITQILIERGIEASLIPHGKTNQPVQHIVDLITDQQHVIEGLFDFVKSSRPLSISYIKEIHAALTEHQETVVGIDSLGNKVKMPLKRGEWKSMSNNPSRPNGTMHEYTPPEHVSSEMDKLIELHLQHQQKHIPPEIEAAWLHHRFTQIHPFQDGNGRVARTLATLIFLRAGWFPPVVTNEERAVYIDSLERADNGNLETLVQFFAKLEEAAFLHALSISEQVVSEQKTYAAIIESVTEKFKNRANTRTTEHKKALLIADKLADITQNIMNELGEELENKVRLYNKEFHVNTDFANQSNSYWFWGQVVAIAKNFDYFANIRLYHKWIRLKIMEARKTEIIISIHPIGTEFDGIVGVSAFIEYRGEDENSESELNDTYPLTDNIFMFTYKDDEKQTITSFKEWLNKVILSGLDEWRRQL